MTLSLKRQNGQYYTEGNPFILEPFQDWIKKHKLSNKKVLEPFAGGNNIIRALQQVSLAKKFTSYDIFPADDAVKYRDTLKDFPTGFELCVTNPPWLARNSAKRRGLGFPETPYDDLYKHALELCLTHCNYVAAIIPASFLKSGDFRPHIQSVIFLHDEGMFADTENPVCLALLTKDPEKKRITIYNDEDFIGYLDELERKLPQPTGQISITFNHPQGALGFIAIDNSRAPSIRFVRGEEIGDYPIGFSSRMITRIDFAIKNIDAFITALNEDLNQFREETKDVFLTPFKGLRKDGAYRRRMDYSLARDFIAKHANTNSRF